jgi:hypothetical protein
MSGASLESIALKDRLSSKKDKITSSLVFLGASSDQQQMIKSKFFKAINSQESVFTAKADPYKRPLILLNSLVKYKPKKWIYKKLDRILLKYVEDDIENLDELGIFKAAEIFPKLHRIRSNQYVVSERVLDLLFTTSK